MIKFNLQLFAISGFELKQLAEDGGTAKKKKKSTKPTAPTTQKQTAPIISPKAPVEEVTTTSTVPTPLAPTTTPRTVTEEVAPIEEVAPQGQEIKPPKTKKEDEPVRDIQAELIEKQKQDAIRRFQDAFAATESRLKAEGEALAPEFREKRTGVRTEDVLQRAGAQQIQEIQGLSGSGAATQSDIAQNVITQGAIGALNEQELEAKRDIERRLTEAQQLRDQGIASAESAADIAVLEAELAEFERKQAQAIKEAEIKSEREFELYKDALDQLNQKELINLQNDINRENALLDAQIQEARDARNFEREKELTDIKQQNNIKLEGIRNANQMAQLRERGSQTLAEIAARGAEDRQTLELKDTFTAQDEEEVLTGKFDDKTVNSAVENALDSALRTKDPFDSGVNLTNDEIKSTVSKFLADNAEDLTEQQGTNLMLQYGLDINDIRAFIQ